MSDWNPRVEVRFSSLLDLARNPSSMFVFVNIVTFGYPTRDFSVIIVHIRLYSIQNSFKMLSLLLN